LKKYHDKTGRPASLPKGHPMNALAMQVAFAVPLSLPLIGSVTLNRQICLPCSVWVAGYLHCSFWFLLSSGEAWPFEKTGQAH